MILAIDTASTLCAACVFDQGSVLGRCVEGIGTGHAERLMAVIDAALAEAGIAYPALDQIAVSVGPGSFTGIRVGVAAARGLALALKIPAHGVTTLSAIAEAARDSHPGRRIVASIDARRDELYVEDHGPDGVRVSGPAMIATSEAVRFADGAPPVLAGSGAPVIAAALTVLGAPFELAPSGATADIAVYARLAAAGRTEGSPPSPFYLRGADARPQDGFALPRRT